MSKTTIDAEKFFCKDTLDTPADILFLGVIASYLGQETTYRLSSKDMKINIGKINPAILSFVRSTISSGWLEDSPTRFPGEATSPLEELREDFLEKNIWSETELFFVLDTSSFIEVSDLAKARGTLYILAHYAFLKITQNETRPLKLRTFMSGTMFFNELVYVLRHNPLFVKSVEAEFFVDAAHAYPKEISPLDIDYSMLFYRTMHQGTLQALSMPEKLEKMKEEGFQEGGIYILWERTKLSKYTPEGHIKSAHIVRVDKISDTTVSLSKFFVGQTYEDLYVELKQSSAEVQEVFAPSMLTREKVIREETFSLSSLAIGNYFLEEKYLLRKIHPLATVESFMLNNGVISKRLLLETELIFFILIEHEIPFDSELFVRMYDLDESWLSLSQPDFAKIRKQIREDKFPIEEFE